VLACESQRRLADFRFVLEGAPEAPARIVESSPNARPRRSDDLGDAFAGL